MIVCDHVFYDVGPRADSDAFLKVRSVHIDDAAIGVAQIVHQSRIGFGCFYGQFLTVGLDALDLGVFRGTVMRLKQMLKTLLDRLCIHIAAGGKFHIIT